MNVNQINTLVLAYVGDSIYELKIRTFLAKNRINNVNRIQTESLKYVTANNQSDFIKKLIDNNVLTQRELEIVKRGRNAKVNSHPKNVDILTYKWATALETLFGYLYILNDQNRIDELIEIIIGE